MTRMRWHRCIRGGVRESGARTGGLHRCKCQELTVHGLNPDDTHAIAPLQKPQLSKGIRVFAHKVRAGAIAFPGVPRARWPGLHRLGTRTHTERGLPTTESMSCAGTSD
jgi:hypothetical protein